MAGMGDGDPDSEARLLAATIPGLRVRVLSAYIPNGQVVGSDKYSYKLAWLARLRRYLDTRCDPQTPLLLCGDYNVAPDDRDVYDPPGWADTVICHPEVRADFQRLLKHPKAVMRRWACRSSACRWCVTPSSRPSGCRRCLPSG